MSLGERYILCDVVAVQWNPGLAARFPTADHTGCRQQMLVGVDGTWQPYTPARCVGWHCDKCGRPTNMMGNHTNEGR